MTIYSGHSHSFDVGIAKELGLNAAVIFNHIVYWLRINAAKDNHVIEGKVWMYEKQQDMADFFGYLTLDDVKKAMVKLLDSGLIIKGNFNSTPFDKTGWYTTSDQNIIQIKKSFTKVPNGTIGRAKRHDPESHMAPSIYKEQEEHQENNIVCIADANGSEKKEEKKTAAPEMQTVRRIEKKNGRGDPISLNWDDLIAYALRKHPNWTLDEMREAWKILDNRDGFVNDLLEFIAGTISNLRDKTRAIYANKGKPRCTSQQTIKPKNETINLPNISKSNSENSSEKGTKDTLLAALKRLGVDSSIRLPPG